MIIRWSGIFGMCFVFVFFMLVISVFVLGFGVLVVVLFFFKVGLRFIDFLFEL